MRGGLVEQRDALGGGVVFGLLGVRLGDGLVVGDEPAAVGVLGVPDAEQVRRAVVLAVARVWTGPEQPVPVASGWPCSSCPRM
ncbi:hypothetical protein [Actinomadura sp. HBU206391]|uniref:hypothetical protein n=1 Tax=Actinomadura sp. HBU206391 TaxID=2731692 RepID=UPI0021C668E6|nr:hypothetical protein [Actinomadura sp. HBU206391]